jgi:hypothetical protein
MVEPPAFSTRSAARWEILADPLGKQRRIPLQLAGTMVRLAL